ncbi:MAG: hypothetical protein HFJ95_02840 [Muribaculaceae bacterium]|nr:hypothetical protein [Muribaculaceae bacterium]
MESGLIFRRILILKTLTDKVRNKILFIVLSAVFFPLVVLSQETDSIVGRPYKSFDTIAFCSYQKFHPSQYLTDNNWDILCAFVEPGKTVKLDSLGIPYNRSQLRLLEIGDLLSYENGIYKTIMPIFGKTETQTIRRQSKEFADSIFPIIEPELMQLITDFDKAGYAKQTYSLIFSYLLDTYIWDNERLASPMNCENHGSWTGAYWAMYDSRSHVKIGTNGFGPIHQNWTDDLGYWLKSNKLIAFAKEVNKTHGRPIENKDVINAIDGWGLINQDGKILIPIMRVGSNDKIDVLCKSITTQLSEAVKFYCHSWSAEHNIASEKLGQIIFYHEVMWDLLDILESKGMISMPPILKGEEVGKEHFGDICFIVLEENQD